jgi:uncharacterized protein YcbK (DUF882 family)
MISQELVDVLNSMPTPFSVVSLTRTPGRNAKVGGSPGSAHLSGKAADLVYDTRADLIAGAQQALDAGAPGIELDLSNLHLHVDVKPRIWRVVTADGGKTEEPLGPWLSKNKPGG